MTYRCLDLFAGIGGAAVGYAQAGFEVEGVDNMPQPDYPFPFYRTGALGILKSAFNPHTKACGPGFLPRFDFIHASPPCQAHSTLHRGWGLKRSPDQAYPDLIAETRELLQQTGIPYVIENVQGAPLIKSRTVTLCGSMFPDELNVVRHRLFEFSEHFVDPLTNALRITAPPHPGRHTGDYAYVYGRGGGKGSVWVWQKAMAIPWTENRYGISQAIPPPYTKYLGLQILQHLQTRSATSLAAVT